jgi:hypothetical protein
MSFTINWHDPEQSILHVINEGNPTWEEYHQKYDAALEAVRAAPHRVDVIMDARTGMPPGNPLPHLKKINEKWDGVPMLGLIIAISARRLQRFTETAVEIGGVIAGIQTSDFVVFVGSMEEALQTIEADRKAKNGLPTLAALRETKPDPSA